MAYLVAAQGQTPALDDLRRFVANKLPGYMVPAQFVLLDRIPLTPNGKVDRRALPKPEDIERGADEDLILPRDAIETRLTDIWSAVLRNRFVGINDNFFDLGGHSLLVAKLISEIDQEFGLQLSMASIFEAPTIARQAAVIKGNSTLSATAAIVPVQSRGSKPPFFCCGFDSGPIFLPLARHMGTDQPLLCVGMTAVEASQLSTPYRMEDIAACVARRIRQVQTDGPYLVGGVCAGGLLAYETARQLMHQGQEVAVLALFEPQTPLVPDGAPPVSGLPFLARKFTFHLGHMRHLDSEEVLPYIRKRIATLRQRADRLSWHTSYKLRSHLKKGNIRRLGDILYLAAESYRPMSYPGRMVLFQAITRPSGQEWDEKVRWRPLAPRLEVEEVPGYHDTILIEPHVNTLAQRLMRYLRPAYAQDDTENDSRV